MYSDFHVHTAFSSDSQTPLLNQVKRACSLGMERICITDHHDIDNPPNSENYTFMIDDVDQYIKEIDEAAVQYKSQIEVLKGLELGIQPHLTAILAEFVHSYPFDFIIGSTHVVDRLDPYFPQFFAGRSERESIQRYFEGLYENIRKFHDFEVIGHIDYAVRYIPDKEFVYDPKDYFDVLDSILRFAIDNGIGIECNTSGYKSALNQPHPHLEIIKRYIELGGEILTIGSDAHIPEHLGWHFDRIGDLLKGLGAKYHTVYKDRKALFLPL